MIHLNQPPSSGSSTGGAGQGNGGQVPENNREVAFRTERLKGTPSGQGRITASMYIKGMGQKGEATAEYTAAREALDKAAEDALDDTDIPLERRSLLRDYFDHIRPGDATGAPAGAEKK